MRIKCLGPTASGFAAATCNVGKSRARPLSRKASRLKVRRHLIWSNRLGFAQPATDPRAVTVASGQRHDSERDKCYGRDREGLGPELRQTGEPRDGGWKPPPRR